MKKYIPAPIKETLRFRQTPEANPSNSTARNKDWNFDLKRNIKIEAPIEQVSLLDDNHTPGNRTVESHPTGEGVVIRGNHPRSGKITADAEALMRV